MYIKLVLFSYYPTRVQLFTKIVDLSKSNIIKECLEFCSCFKSIIFELSIVAWLAYNIKEYVSASFYISIVQSFINILPNYFYLPINADSFPFSIYTYINASFIYTLSSIHYVIKYE